MPYAKVDENSTPELIAAAAEHREACRAAERTTWSTDPKTAEGRRLRAAAWLRQERAGLALLIAGGLATPLELLRKRSYVAKADAQKPLHSRRTPAGRAKYEAALELSDDLELEVEIAEQKQYSAYLASKR